MNCVYLMSRGKYGRSKIDFIEKDVLRPTTCKMRETLFSWLNSYIHDSKVLDLFCGSGVLSFEALSMGASEVVACERDNEIYSKIIQNISKLKCTNFNLENTDALYFIKKKIDSGFDIIFLDPPFGLNLVSLSLNILLENNYINSKTIVYIESEKKESFPNFIRIKYKKSGNVHHSLFMKV